MAVSIIIVGGLSDDPDHSSFVKSLSEKTGDDVEWDWIKADASAGFRPPNKYFSQLLAKLRRFRNHEGRPRVVKLHQLHGKSAHQLYQAYEDPVLVPPDVDTAQQLIEWLLSPAANLFPRHEWLANTKEAALVAILCKLIRNKSWNKDTQGHAWTKEADLLGQTPVSREGHPNILIEATRMLPTLQNKLLLAKGAGQGKTPKEWCIRLTHVNAVKKAIIDQSLAPLSAVAELANMIHRIATAEDRPHRLDGGVVRERERQLCRDRD